MNIKLHLHSADGESSVRIPRACTLVFSILVSRYFIRWMAPSHAESSFIQERHAWHLRYLLYLKRQHRARGCQPLITVFSACRQRFKAQKSWDGWNNPQPWRCSLSKDTLLSSTHQIFSWLLLPVCRHPQTDAVYPTRFAKSQHHANCLIICQPPTANPISVGCLDAIWSMNAPVPHLHKYHSYAVSVSTC